MRNPADLVELEATQAGKFLNRSAGAVRMLLDRGVLKGRRVGSHRKVTMAELRRYRRERERLDRLLGVRELRL